MLEKIQPQETLTIYQRTNLEKKSSGKKKKVVFAQWISLLFLVTYSASRIRPATKLANSKNSNVFAGCHWYFQNDVRTALLTCHIFDHRNKTDSKNAIKSGLVKFFWCDSQQTHKNRRSLYLFYFKVLSNFDIGIVNTVGILFYIKTARSKRNCRQFAM